MMTNTIIRKQLSFLWTYAHVSWTTLLSINQEDSFTTNLLSYLEINVEFADWMILTPEERMSFEVSEISWNYLFVHERSWLHVSGLLSKFLSSIIQQALILVNLHCLLGSYE